MEIEITKDKIRCFINEIIEECNERSERSLEGEEIRINLLGAEDYEKNIVDMGIDSLGYIRLIILLEGYYNIEFRDEDIMAHKLRSVKNFYEVIYKLLADK